MDPLEIVQSTADPAFATDEQGRIVIWNRAAVTHGGGSTAGLSTAKPPWGRTLNERQIEDAVQFIRTFSVPDEVRDELEP